MADSPVKVGGPYVENKDFVPNPTDIHRTFNTHGVGAHGKIEEVSSVFEVDRVKVAEEVKGALDPKDSTVDASRVLLPEQNVDNETAKEDLLRRADARLKQGVEIGGPGPAEREAAKDGEEGVRAARQQEADNAAANSTGDRSGTHTPDVEAKGDDDKSGAAKKTASSQKK